MTDWVLGIDFGTSFTAAAHTAPATGNVEALALNHDGNLMASAVLVHSPEQIDVGDLALNRASTNPGAFIASPKRSIGQGSVWINGYDLPMSTVVAAVLREVTDRAIAAHDGVAPAHLVLTHPERWTSAAVDVLVDAARLIGFAPDRIETISEPEAAARFYTRTRAAAPGSRIVVFDFGGGTVDVAVLAGGTEGFTVLASDGEPGLGGKSLDASLRRWVDARLQESNPDLLDYLRRDAPPHVLRDLDDSIRRAKELLSTAQSATIGVVGAGIRENLTITRREFEDVIAGDVDRAVELTRYTVRAAAERAGPDAGVTEIYLTGGSSQIPLVQHRLAQIAPIATLDDPKTVVVRGAVLQHLATAESAAADGSGPSAARRTGGGLIGLSSGRSEAGAGRSVGAARGPIRWWMVSAFAIVALVVIGFGARAALGSDGGTVTGRAAPATTSAAADGEGTDTAGTATGTAAASTGAAPADGVAASFPSGLVAATSDCRPVGSTGTGAPQVLCTIRPDNPATAHFDTPTMAAYYASVDVPTTSGMFRGWQQQGPWFGYRFVENADGRSGAILSADETSPGMGYYANADSGLTVSLLGVTPGSGNLTEVFTQLGLI
ncbi:Hsp70 family protein [Millisia brevis]|uniref:Hsp70 family protein n=1 Tax=Millisia brevis TaxID=264148 RepID=UPI0008350211|nr:Hsp70 family protein [Millisia brevis]